MPAVISLRTSTYRRRTRSRLAGPGKQSCHASAMKWGLVVGLETKVTSPTTGLTSEGENHMAEEKQFHFAAETSLGHIEGDLHLEIEGNDVEGTFNALGVEMHLRDGHYEDGRFSGSFKESILFTPVEGTIEGQIEGDECTLQLTTASGTRTLHSI